MNGLLLIPLLIKPRFSYYGVDDSDPERLIRQADLIAEEFGEDYRRTARITTLIDPPAGTSELLAAAINVLNQRMTQVHQ